MSATSLYRWSGIALTLGSVLGLIVTIMSAILYPGKSLTVQQVLNTPFTLAAFLFLAWGLLLAMGLPGLYLRQATRAGVVGFVGFVLLALSLLLGGVGFGIVQATLYPYLAQFAPKLLPGDGAGPDAGFLLWIFAPTIFLAVGSILLGIATRRARVFPSWIGILLIASGILFLLSIPSIPSPLGDIIDIACYSTLFLALGWSGYLLTRLEAQAVAHPVAQVGASR